MPRLLSSLLIALVCSQPTYKALEKFNIECRNSTTQSFEPYFKCTESGKILEFQFNAQEFIHCGWKINSPADLIFITRAIKQEEFLACRVPVNPDLSEYVPINIPFMGVAQGTQVTVAFRMGFVFHHAMGRIIAASVYPIAGQLQLVKVGSVITMHGATRWVAGAADRESSSSSSSSSFSGQPHEGLADHLTVFWLLVLTVLAAISAFVAIYFGYLRPRLVRTFLKTD